MRASFRSLALFMMAVTILLATIRLARHISEIFRIPPAATPDRILPLAGGLALIGLNALLIYFVLRNPSAISLEAMGAISAISFATIIGEPLERTLWKLLDPERKVRLPAIEDQMTGPIVLLIYLISFIVSPLGPEGPEGVWHRILAWILSLSPLILLMIGLLLEVATPRLRFPPGMGREWISSLPLPIGAALLLIGIKWGIQGWMEAWMGAWRVFGPSFFRSPYEAYAEITLHTALAPLTLSSALAWSAIGGWNLRLLEKAVAGRGLAIGSFLSALSFLAWTASILFSQVAYPYGESNPGTLLIYVSIAPIAGLIALGGTLALASARSSRGAPWLIGSGIVLLLSSFLFLGMSTLNRTETDLAILWCSCWAFLSGGPIGSGIWLRRAFPNPGRT